MNEPTPAEGPEAQGLAIAQAFGLEISQLSPLERVEAALLEQHGLEPGQTERLPAEVRSQVEGFRKLAALQSAAGAMARLFMARAGAGAGFSSGAFLARGEYQGYRVSIHCIQRGEEGLATGVSLRFPRPLGLGLRIRREGLAHKLGKLLRLTQDLQVDDPRLDPLVLIQAEDSAGAAGWLGDPGLREDLCVLFELSEGIEVWDWGLRFEGLGEEQFQVARIRAILEAMVPVASYGPRP